MELQSFSRSDGVGRRSFHHHPGTSEFADWGGYCHCAVALGRRQCAVKNLMCFSGPVKAPGQDFHIRANSLG